MRIAFLALCLVFPAVLAGCTSHDAPSAAANQRDLGGAQAFCLKKGLRPGTYNYDSCYRNRPEVQSVERSNRLRDNGIILKNRSVYSSYRGRSYPVE